LGGSFSGNSISGNIGQVVLSDNDHFLGEQTRPRVWWSAPPPTTSWHLLYFILEERKQSARARVLPGTENACVAREVEKKEWIDKNPLISDFVLKARFGPVTGAGHSESCNWEQN
jgi:hypothetical protein